jgi:glyoxylase-like metal-dependent hydrolase (beta-lactamase superfamily II)
MKRILLLGNLDTNCYFIEDGKKCYIIDPGYEKNKIIKYVSDYKLEVLGILLTHAHIDHIGAIDCFPVPIYLHEFECAVLMNSHKNCADLFDIKLPYDINSLNIVSVNENTELYLSQQLIQIIHTPGHTIGSICYKINKELYTGDTLFKNSVGRWDLPTGSEKDSRDSILKLIDEQDENMKVYPGHGPSTTIKEEKENNIYYKSWKSH